MGTTLKDRIREVAERARAEGAIEPIPTTYELVADGPIQFCLRVITSLNKKLLAKTEPVYVSEHDDPFLPYDPRVFVEDLSKKYVCLLNKYCVSDGHILLVTREFEPQDRVLNCDDFAAWWRCLAEIDGLGFYNSGPVAGASQAHMHLQLVPLPLVPEGPQVPVEPALHKLSKQGTIYLSRSLPFRHAIAPGPPSIHEPPGRLGESSWKSYARLMQVTGRVESMDDQVPVKPYNLLITRQWMMLVPRRQECFGEVSLNGLAFAGSLLLRSTEQLEAIKQAGPMKALQAVTLPV